MARRAPQTRPTCSCIIPFYNEGHRILTVLDVVTQVKGLSQIICVDDGSEDEGSELLRGHFPHVTVVELPRNRGKAEAIQEGLEFVRGDYVLLLDADLRSLEAQEIAAAIAKIVGHPRIDMIVLRRFGAPHCKLSRGDVLFSGERVLRTEDLARILRADPQKYQLEIAINQYMMDHHKLVYWMPSSARNTYKMDKLGLKAGLAREIMMLRNMMSYRGIGAYVEQFLSFAKKRAPDAQSCM
jgi:glycosyltransferase involved in cell wall biosynthesis